MSGREVQLHDLIGRPVRDVDGRVVGRLEEVLAVIDESSEYVVQAFYVGRYPVFEGLAGARFGRHLLRRLGRLLPYRRFEVPWELMDLSEIESPRLRAALTTDG